MFWIIAIIVIVLIIGWIISGVTNILGSDNIFLKVFALCVVTAIALAIIFWITDITLFITIIKIIAIIAVIDIAIPIVLAIFKK